MSPLDAFDFTTSELPVASAKPTFFCGEPTGCPISNGQFQDVEPQEFIHPRFGSTVGCHLEVEDCVPPPCRPALVVLSQSNSEHKRESASPDSKPSPRRKSSPNNRIGKQSSDIEGSRHGNQATRGSKTAHSIIERKYRENLNAKIAQLQETLTTTDYFAQDDSRLSNEALAPTAVKPRKGDVLTRTIDYIQHAEIDKRHMSEEIKLLRSQLSALKGPSKCDNCSLVNQLRALQLQVPFKF
jgi:hypothetical protein